MAKKIETKKEVVAVSEALVPAAKTSAAMAVHANFDMSMFEGVKLDIAENKELFKNDFLIPKIWLVQAMSDFRKEKKADEGEYVDSQSAEVLAPVGGVLRIVVLKTFKRWQTFEKQGDKREFVSSEIMVFGKNHNLPYEETVDGKDLIRKQVISAYVLIERDVRAGLNKPYIIDFASTSKYGGRVLVSDIATLNANKLPAFTAFFELSAEEESFEKGDAFVKKVKFGGYMSKETMPFLIDCYKHIETIENQIVIDDNDLIKNADVEGEVINQDTTVKAAAAASQKF